MQPLVYIRVFLYVFLVLKRLFELFEGGGGWFISLLVREGEWSLTCSSDGWLEETRN